MSNTTLPASQFPVGEDYDRQRMLSEINHLYEVIREVGNLKRVAVAQNYDVSLTDDLVALIQGTLTITLARPRPLVKFQRFVIKDESGSGGHTVAAPAGNTIDGSATKSVGAYEVLDVYWNGENYFTL